MVPSTSTARTNWLELQSKLIPKKYKESNVCVAGGMKMIEYYIKLNCQIYKVKLHVEPSRIAYQKSMRYFFRISFASPKFLIRSRAIKLDMTCSCYMFDYY